MAVPSVTHDMATLAVRMTARSERSGQRPDWSHSSTRTGAVVSLSREGAYRSVTLDQAGWRKAAELRGER